MMDVYHYTFVRTHGIYNTKSKLQGKLWTLGGYDLLCRLISCNKCWRILIMGETMHVWGQEIWEISVL